MVSAMRTRNLVLLCLFIPSAAVVACSGDTATNDAGADATTDAPSSNDAAPDVKPSDGGGGDAATDGGGGDAGDGGTVLNVTCTSPSGCDGGAYCCGTIALSGGTPPDCNVGSITTACQTQCTTMLPFDCNSNDVVRFCSQPSDCTEQAYNKCCTFQTGGQSTTFCANAGIAATVDASCM
jgi:hypothetical protein